MEKFTEKLNFITITLYCHYLPICTFQAFNDTQTEKVKEQLAT